MPLTAEPACPAAQPVTAQSRSAQAPSVQAPRAQARLSRAPLAQARLAERVADAQDFFRLLAAEREPAAASAGRLADVLAQLAATGTYWQTEQELTWGARIGWRNTPRCVGKFYWKALAVRDLRHLTTADGVFAALVEHLRTAYNGGRVKLLLSVFAPQQPGRPGIRIWNQQLIRYAGYRQADGSVIGDPANVEFTDTIRRLGWTGGMGGRFDVLPLVIQMPDEEPRIYDLPADAAPEVPITHPDLAWFADLGLRWPAYPSISNQRLEIGGVVYPAAPFSAWYTGAEIGARNLSDANRYNMLEAVARGMGLDTRSDRTLWKDRAMIELVAAVHHSFDQAGVSLIDHHFAARQFVKHELREQEAGRSTPAQWELIVPPTGGSATPLWERRYQPTELRPAFVANPVVAL